MKITVVCAEAVSLGVLSLGKGAGQVRSIFLCSFSDLHTVFGNLYYLPIFIPQLLWDVTCALICE